MTFENFLSHWTQTRLYFLRGPLIKPHDEQLQQNNIQLHNKMSYCRTLELWWCITFSSLAVCPIKAFQFELKYELFSSCSSANQPTTRFRFHSQDHRDDDDRRFLSNWSSYSWGHSETLLNGTLNLRLSRGKLKIPNINWTLWAKTICSVQVLISMVPPRPHTTPLIECLDICIINK